MTKSISLFAITTLAAFAFMIALSTTASAATISDPLFSNGQTSIDVTGGSTVNGTFTLTVGPGEVVEWIRTTPDTQPFTETSVGGQLGYQEGVHLNVPFSAKMNPNTGNYNVNVQGAGTFAGNRSIHGGDNVVVGPTSVGMVRVVASTGSGTSVGGTSYLEQLIAELTVKVGCLMVGQDYDATTKACKAPVVTKPAFCASMPLVNSWSGSAQVMSLQSWMVQNNFMTAAQISTGPGIYGPKTTAAHFAAQAACN